MVANQDAKFSVVIPVYNEKRAVADTIKQVQKVLERENHEIIVVNDGSTDGTEKVLSNIPSLKVLAHEKNRGYGASLKTGIRNAKGEYIIITDADGTYPISEIPNLIKHVPAYDMVVGARIGVKVQDPILRRPAKLMLKWVARAATGINIPDLNSGLRIFKKDLALRFWGLYPNGFSFTTTITIAALSNDYAVKYIPINYFKRKGKSAISPFKDFVGFNLLIFKVALYFAPLKFFTPASIILLLMGIFKGIFDFMNAGMIGIFSAILVLFAIQIFFFGLLADLVNKRM